MAKVLVIDDEKLLRWSLRRKCEEWGYAVIEAASRVEAWAQLRSEHPDLILLDVKLPDGDGVALLTAMRQDGYAGPVVMITADPRIEDVKTALRQGAFDYLSKPVDFDELAITMANALENSRLRGEVDTLRDQARRQFAGLELVGKSSIMTALLAFVHKLAASEAGALLLQGESGTGKDLIAQIVHQHSARRDRPFIAVNCSAIPDGLLESELFGHEKGAFTDAKAMKKGLFEMANGGTLFLDEIGELPLLLQSKLLRALESQCVRRVGGLRDIAVDVRAIAASNRNLEQAVRAGEFRQDLYYRLGVIPVFVPPLRSRREDIPVLAAFFIEQYNRRFRKAIQGFTPEAERLMREYDWPGNVRELKNAVQRAMILEEGARIGANCLPFFAGSTLLTAAAAFPENRAVGESGWEAQAGRRSLPAAGRIPSSGTSLDGIERQWLERALEQTRGNQTRAAALLDISRDALRYKMKKHGLTLAEENPGQV